MLQTTKPVVNDLNQIKERKRKERAVKAKNPQPQNPTSLNLRSR
jgi:hypothetical protein